MSLTVGECLWPGVGETETPLEVPMTNERERQTYYGAINLLLRLRDYQEDTLRSLFDPHVPFTNNQADRALRTT